MPAKNQFVTAKITSAKVKKWWDRIHLAQEERKRHEKDWDLLIEAYKPTVKAVGRPEDIKSNTLFRNVEQKKASLFFRTPEMKLRPKEMAKDPIGQDPQTGQPLTMEQAVTIHEHVLNYYMGDDGINLPLLMDLTLFDCLCPSGWLVSKIGYQPYIKMVKQPVMQPAADEFGEPMVDPQTGEPGEVPAMDERGRPVTEEVPVLVHEDYFWSRVSPKRALVPDTFHSTKFEDAPWLGVEFDDLPLKVAKQIYGLPKDFKPTKGTNSDDRLLGKDRKASESKEETVSGVELFYKAHLEIDDVVHPDVYYQLVLIEGHKDGSAQAAAVHRLSPYQSMDPNTMKLTADSMIGNPIHIGTLRDLSDSAYVPSDCAMIHTQVKEIDTYRRQSVKLRDANLTKFAFDTDKLTPAALSSIKNGDVGQYVALQGGTLQGGVDKVIAPLTKGTGSRVDTETVFALERDTEMTLALGANQNSAQTEGVRTATELSIMQSSSNVRMEKEQQRVLAYAIQGIRKFDSLLQRFADDEEVIEIVGEAGINHLQIWNKETIAGRFMYDIKPDSQLRIDAATERNLHMQFYNLTAQDPFNKRIESLKKLQRLFGIDPAKGTQEPPQPPPEEPSISMAISGEDLIGPAAPMMIEILEQRGVTISEENKRLAAVSAIRTQMDEITEGPQDELAGPTAHGGPAERIQPIDKSQQDHTGSQPGPKVG